MTTAPASPTHHYLQSARDAIVWKLDGLSPYDVRRPMTPTGTNLLGLVKHLVEVEIGYLGDAFGRPFPEPVSWVGEGAGLFEARFATAEESVDGLVALYRRACAHSDDTVAALGLDGKGDVFWWEEGGGEVTVAEMLAHVLDETDRHLGQADVVRELVDGSTGWREGISLVPEEGVDWDAHRAMLEEVARAAARG